MTSLFTDADIIHRYTRAQAIDDGVLAEIPAALAQQAGFLCPIAMTATAYGDVAEWPANEPGQDTTGRLWDVLMAFKIAARHAGDSDCVTFTVLRVPRGGTAPRPVRLVGHIGPGDDGEMVMTVMFPGED